MLRARVLHLLLLASLLVGCVRPADPPQRPVGPEASPEGRTVVDASSPDQARVARAQAALLPLEQGLMAALGSALEEGPEAAIVACRIEAPRLAEGAESGGLRLGRTSHRLRNPDNAPQAWVEPLLAAYVEGADEPWRTVDLPEGALGYVEPIRMQPLCLTCHGASLGEAVEVQLATLYPGDRATGFTEGELRGLFWAVVPAEP